MGEKRRRNVQFPLNNQRSCGDNLGVLPAGVLDDNDVVSALLLHLIELVSEPFVRYVADCCENAQAVEEPAGKVVAAQSTQDVALGQGGLDLGGEQVGSEEGGHGVGQLSGSRGACRY